VARNRKRAKERRARRPQPVVTGRNEREESAPSPIRHAAPDAELAEAQMALGRPEPSEAGESEPEIDEQELELEADDAGAGGGRDRGNGAGFGDDSSGGGELAVPGSAAPGERARIGSRLINFLQGSWRELQRVQWPDRRQVMQATGVVIGFVIVAGLFLGVADTLASHLMNYVLYGKW
jgi:preprotein translocase subunit SecE